MTTRPTLSMHPGEIKDHTMATVERIQEAEHVQVIDGAATLFLEERDPRVVDALSGADPVAAAHELLRSGARANGATVARGALVIKGITVSDGEVLHEASRWRGGKRGEIIELPDIDGADVTEFVTRSLCVGARLIAAAGEVNGVASLANQVAHLADQAEQVTRTLVVGASQAGTDAVTQLQQAVSEVRDATTKSVDDARDRMERNVEATARAAAARVDEQITALLGSEHGQVAAAIRGVVTDAMSNAITTINGSFIATMRGVTEGLDASNPSSPLAHLAHELRDQQERQHGDLTMRLDRLHDELVQARGIAETAAAVAQVTSTSPAKGRTFEEAAGDQLEAIAAGVGASYTSTADTVGAVARSRKGDGVIDLPAERGGPAVRIVVEMTTTGAARKWPAYLEEAERNREAQASLGIVPEPSLVPGRTSLAVVGDARIVVAYEPECDDGALLRACVQLLALLARHRSLADDDASIDTVRESIRDALQQMTSIAELRKTAGTVRAGAAKLELGLEAAYDGLMRSLERARRAVDDYATLETTSV